jgi:hypothetical protein
MRDGDYFWTRHELQNKSRNSEPDVVLQIDRSRRAPGSDLLEREPDTCYGRESDKTERTLCRVLLLLLLARRISGTRERENQSCLELLENR